MRLRSAELALWGVALVVFGVALVRTLRVEWSYLPGAAPPQVEDRRAHHFRHLTYGQADRTFRHMIRLAQLATTPRDRATLLARAAAFQQERGYADSAKAAGEQALQIAGNDASMRAEILAILRQPVRLEDVLTQHQPERSP